MQGTINIEKSSTYMRIISLLHHSTFNLLNQLRSRVDRQGVSVYCRSGNNREVLIFANFARWTNSRIQESRKNYFYKSATKEK